MNAEHFNDAGLDNDARSCTSTTIAQAKLPASFTRAAIPSISALERADDREGK